MARTCALWRTVAARRADVLLAERMTSTSMRRTRARRSACNSRPSSAAPETLTTTAPSLRHTRIPATGVSPSTSAGGTKTAAATTNTPTDRAVAHVVVVLRRE